MSTLGGLIYAPQTLFAIISDEPCTNHQLRREGVEQGREEGPRHFAERGRREGVEQGRKEGRMLSVIDVISARFGSNNAEALKPTLESIEDTALLPRILIKACQVENYSKQ
jgi:flagellar biosynthesis/type III secretory pathway protein FliH